MFDFDKFKFKRGPSEIEGSTLAPPSTSHLLAPQDAGTLRPINDIRTNDEIDNSMTSIVSAFLSAVLALVVLLLAIFTVQAVRRRRRERQGTLLNQPVVHTIAPPAFAPTTAAYISRSGLTSSRFMTWENVTHSSAPVLHPRDTTTTQYHHHQLQQPQSTPASNHADIPLTASASTSSSSSASSSSNTLPSSSLSFSCL